jgi:hypothetical protein
MFSLRILKSTLVAVVLTGAATISPMPVHAIETAGQWRDGALDRSNVKVQYVRDRIVYRNGRRVLVRDRPSYRSVQRRAYPRAYAPRRAYTPRQAYGPRGYPRGYPRVYAPSRGPYWYPERPRPGRSDQAVEGRR